jgi:hypothetical protein
MTNHQWAKRQLKLMLERIGRSIAFEAALMQRVASELLGE